MITVPWVSPNELRRFGLHEQVALGAHCFAILVRSPAGAPFVASLWRSARGPARAAD